MTRSNHRRFMEGSCRLLGVAALIAVIGSGIPLAQSDSPHLPLQGPIPFEAFDLDETAGERASRRDEA